MARPVRPRTFTVSTTSGPVKIAEIVDFSKFSESAQFDVVCGSIARAIQQCKPTDPVVDELVLYYNRVVKEHNSRFARNRMKYITTHTTAAKMEVTTTSKTPAIESAVQLRDERLEKKTATFADLSALVKGMSEEDQIAMLLTMGGGTAEKLVDMTGGATEAEQIEYFCSNPDYKGVPTPVSGFVTTKETIFGDVWTITRYPDRTSVVNGTYICTRTNPIDTVEGGIHGEAPYCFLIALWHANRAFMRTRGFKSPCELFNVLKHAGKIIAPGKMFERDSILPVAKFLNVTIMVIVNDSKDERFNDGLIGDGPEMLHVYLVSLKSRHYVSDTE